MLLSATIFIFQDRNSNCVLVPAEMNEFNALRLCILKAISSVPYNTGLKHRNVKSVSVDVPCSQEMFIKKFVSILPRVQYCNEDQYKVTVSASDLSSVFGENWHIFQYSHSSTRCRVIGLIVIHFRKKTMRIGLLPNTMR